MILRLLVSSANGCPFEVAGFSLVCPVTARETEAGEAHSEHDVHALQCLMFDFSSQYQQGLHKVKLLLHTENHF